jgi:hypothetical protein
VPYYCKQRLDGECDAPCKRDSTCGLNSANINDPNINFASSHPTETTPKNNAIRSVGALTWPPVANWATAFLVGDNYILTAGHVLHDRQLACSQTFMLNLERDEPVNSRFTTGLDLIPITNDKKWIQQLDDNLDFALCKIDKTPPPPFRQPVPADEPPKSGDVLYVIHHATFARVKQISEVTCVAVKGQHIFMDKGLDSGSSGGLIVNSEWKAVGLYTHGGATPSRGILLGAIAQHILNNPLTSAELVRLPAIVSQVDVDLSLLPRRTPLQPFVPRGFSNSSKRMHGLPDPVEKAFDSTGIVVMKATENGAGRVGTCVMLENNWILTAHHIADCSELAEKLCVDFNYKKGEALNKKGADYTLNYTLDPASGFYTSWDGIYSCDGSRYEHDFALVKVKYVGQRVATPMPIARRLPPKRSAAYLIQHPRKLQTGVFKAQYPLDPLHADMCEDFDEYGFAYHSCERDNGASGGPLVSADGTMFAMHTHRADPNENLFPLRRKFNWGVTLAEIAKQLNADDPEQGGNPGGKAILEQLPSLKALLG